MFWGPFESPIFGAGIFIFTGHRPIMVKFVNTEYEKKEHPAVQALQRSTSTHPPTNDPPPTYT
jgi:hypothetical protein